MQTKFYQISLSYIVIAFIYHSSLFAQNVIPEFSQAQNFSADSSKSILNDKESKNQAFYDSLRSRSGNNKITQMLIGKILVKPKAQEDTVDFYLSYKSFEKFWGKRIGKIRFLRVDTFTGDVDDTTGAVSTSIITNTLDQLHYETRDEVILKNLLFEEGDIVDHYLLSDNERVLRELSYIEDARIYASLNSADTNLVIVTIVTQDVYSLGITASVNSSNSAKFRVFDRNIFGTGSELHGTFIYDGSKIPKNGVELEYRIDNLFGSFISASFLYRKVPSDETGKIEFNRKFITPETKYAGGILLENTLSKLSVSNSDTVFNIPFTRNTEDLWIGRQFLISENGYRRNLSFAGRAIRSEYTTRPVVTPDSNETFHTVHYALGSVMFSHIRYFESNLILGFGQTEDVPVGYRIKFTGGKRWSEFRNHYYSGVLASGANYYNYLGYLNLRAEFANLFDGKIIQERIFKTDLLHFTPLLHLGNYRIRNFILSQYIIGLELGKNMNLHFTPETGIRGLPNINLNGKQRFTLAMETLTFTPWNLYGFKFAFYGFADVGFLGPSNKRIDPQNVYTGFGFGFRIRNESLVFKTLQLRFAFYPKVPAGMGNSQFTLSTKEEQLFENFSGARPEIISFK